MESRQDLRRTALVFVGSAAVAALLASPLRAAPEIIAPWETENFEKGGEEAEAQAMAELLIGKLAKDYTDQGKRVLRDAHPHAQGCVEAKFTVNDHLDPRYQVGVFKYENGKPKSYDALVRFSSSGALGLFPDNVPDARGMMIKLFNVPGEKLLAREKNATTHDFVMINYPIFPTTTAAEFQDLAAAGFGNPLPFLSVKDAAQVKLRFIEVANLLKSTVLKLNDASVLQQQYFSMSPYLFGRPGSPGAIPIKFSTKPCEPINNHATKPAFPGPNYLREELQDFLTSETACFDFMIQLYKEGKGFEVESAANWWHEEDSPFIKIARLTIKPQKFTSDAKLEYCDNLVNQPWHALPEHRPLGNINRVRKTVYEAISNYRHDKNQANDRLGQPTSLDEYRSIP